MHVCRYKQALDCGFIEDIVLEKIYVQAFCKPTRHIFSDGPVCTGKGKYTFEIFDVLEYMLNT